MEQNEEIKRDTQYLFYRVAEDSTRWDRMTGGELKKRIKNLLADDKRNQKQFRGSISITYVPPQTNNPNQDCILYYA